MASAAIQKLELMKKLSDSGHLTTKAFEFCRKLIILIEGLDENHWKEIQLKTEEIILQVCESGAGTFLRGILSTIMITMFNKGSTQSLPSFVGHLVATLSSSKSDVSTKLTGLHLMGEIYLHMGRNAITYISDTLNICTKGAKSEGPIKMASYTVVYKLVRGCENAAKAYYPDIWKLVRNGISEKASQPDYSSKGVCADTLKTMAEHSNISSIIPLDTLVSACLKALDDPSSSIRRQVADAFGVCMPSYLTANTAATKLTLKGRVNQHPVEMVAEPFINAYTKATQILCVRTGIAQVFISFYNELQSKHTDLYSFGDEEVLTSIMRPALQLLETPKMFGSPYEVVLAQSTLVDIINLGICHLMDQSHLVKTLSLLVAFVKYDLSNTERSCALLNLIGLLFVKLSGAAASIRDNALEVIDTCLRHNNQHIRLHAAFSVAQLLQAFPNSTNKVINQYTTGLIEKYQALTNQKASNIPEVCAAINGYSMAVTGILETVASNQFNVSQSCFATLVTYVTSCLGAAANELADNAIQENAWIVLGGLCHLGYDWLIGRIQHFFTLWKQGLDDNVDLVANLKKKNTPAILRSLSLALQSYAVFLEKCQSHFNTKLRKQAYSYLQKPLSTASRLPLVSATPIAAREAVSIFKDSALRCLRTFPSSFLQSQGLSLLEVCAKEILDADGSPSSAFRLKMTAQSMDTILDLSSSIHIPSETLLQATGIVSYADITRLKSIANHLDTFPWSLNPEVSCMDVCMEVYGQFFHLLPESLRLQHVTNMKEHLNTHQTKTFLRSNIPIANIFSALRGIVSGMSKNHTAITRGPFLSVLQEILQTHLPDPDPMIRKVSCEMLGQLSAIVPSEFVTAVIRAITKQLNIEDANVKSGFALGVGSLHRFVGVAILPHLQTTTSILINLAKHADPAVQVWSLHALSLVVESAGPAIQAHVNDIMELLLYVLFENRGTFDHPRLHVCIARIIVHIVEAYGPEISQHKVYAFLVEQSKIFCDDPLFRTEVIKFFHKMVAFDFASVEQQHLLILLNSSLSSRSQELLLESFSCLQSYLERCDCSRLNLDALVKLVFRVVNTQWDAARRAECQKVVEVLVEKTGLSATEFWVLAATNPAHLLTKSSTIKHTPTRVDDDGEDESEGRRAVDASDASRSSIPNWHLMVLSVKIGLQLFKVYQREIEESSRSGAHLTAKKDVFAAQLGKIASMTFKSASSQDDSIQLLGIHLIQELCKFMGPLRDKEYPESSILEPYIAQIVSAIRQGLAAEVPESTKAAAIQAAYDAASSHIFKDANQAQKVSQILWTSYDNLPSLEVSQVCGDVQFHGFQISLLSVIAKLAMQSEELGGIPVQQYLGSHAESILLKWIAFFADFAKLTYQPVIYKAQEGHYFAPYSRKLMQPLIVGMEVWGPIVNVLGKLLPIIESLSKKKSADAFHLVVGYILWHNTKVRPLAERIQLLQALTHLLSCKQFWIDEEGNTHSNKYFSEILSSFQQLIEEEEDLQVVLCVASAMDKFCEGLVTHSDQRAPELLELIVETILKTLHILLESPANIGKKGLVR
eukprot:TRINITY_DN7620_c0_g1_i4.p1 TRINITY_DN7620_c0_g1~~TRINITY_DN7620_c0_g1_i4.p1  ORF type:complete len:1554 (-),score=305.46 TRINITY_DN7620_c0_g1_i4:13-4674(-)